MSNSQRDLGNRISTARKASGLTQAELASKIDLDRTAVTRLENGDRRVDSFELAKIARALTRPVTWFLETPVPSVVSRREARENIETGADITLETLASDVGQLVEMNLLSPAKLQPLGRTIESADTAESAAGEIRRRLAEPTEPIVDLVQTAEKLGLYTFVLNLEEDVEGSYVALPDCGVALVQGKSRIGKRRFTLVHELGHHILQDEYSTVWITGEREERERLINIFAIHFLLPRPAVIARWQRLNGTEDPRNAAIHLAVDFGVSWSAVCSHLNRLELISEEQRRDLARNAPGKADYIELQLQITDKPVVPTIPLSFAASVMKGYRKQLLGSGRVIELMRGTLDDNELPPQRDLPLDALIGELDPL